MTPDDINQALAPYGATLNTDGRIVRNGSILGVYLRTLRGRLRAETAEGRLLYSGPAHTASVEAFVEKFWYWEKKA